MEALTVHLTTGQGDVWWPGLVLLGFFIGIITSLFGVGGGFLLAQLPQFRNDVLHDAPAGIKIARVHNPGHVGIGVIARLPGPASDDGHFDPCSPDHVG